MTKSFILRLWSFFLESALFLSSKSLFFDKYILPLLKRNVNTIPELNLKTGNVKNIIRSVEDLCKHFRLLVAMDINEAESDLEDMETHLKKIEVRLKNILTVNC